MAVLESYSTTSSFFSACLDENKHSENWLKCSKMNKKTLLMRKLDNKQRFAPKINTSPFTALTKSSILLGFAEHASKWPWPTPTQRPRWTVHPRISVKVPRNPTCAEGTPTKPRQFSFTGWWLNQPIWNILVLDHFLQVGVKIRKIMENRPSLLNLFWRLESKTKPEQYYNLWANMSILGDFSRCSLRAENSSSWCLWWACVSNKLVQLAYLGKHKHIWNISNISKEATIK